jgi:hypothetical protein
MPREVFVMRGMRIDLERANGQLEITGKSDEKEES